MALLVGATTINKDKTAQNMLLKGNTTNDVTLAWNEPSAARTLTIPDPGANTSFVFQNRSISTSTGLTGGGDLSADRSLSVVANSVVEKIKVDSGGTLIGTRQEVNFIQGSNVTLTVADNAGSDRVDVTIASATGATGANPTAQVGLTAVNGTATTFLRSDGAPSLDQSIAPTWTGLHIFNPGTTPTNAAYLQIAAPGVAGTRNSHNFLIRGASFDTIAHTTDWQQFVSVTSNAGVSTFKLQSRIDAGAFSDRLTIDDAGNVTVPGNLTVSGTTTTVNSTTLTVADKNIQVNYGGTTAAAGGSGVDVVGDSNATIGALRFATGAAGGTKFQVGDGTTMYDITGVTATQTLTNKKLGSGSTLGDSLAQDDGLASGKALTLGNLGTATSVTTGYGSQTFIMNGSSWTGTVAQAHQFQILSSVTDQNTAKLVFAKKVGAGSVTNVASIDMSGNLTLLGTITESGTP